MNSALSPGAPNRTTRERRVGSALRNRAVFSRCAENTDGHGGQYGIEDAYRWEWGVFGRLVLVEGLGIRV